jgi:hypothetical protein
LTFEKVWAALMESRRMMDESKQDWKKQMEESRKQMDESKLEWKMKMDESRKQMEESRKQLEKDMATMTKNVGGLGNTLGRLTEAMFANELWKKFSEIGFPVTRQSSPVKFCDTKQVLAEVDIFIENGEYAIAVEVKTDLTVSHVDDHLERIEVVRRYLDVHGDKRKLIGAVAGGIVSESVIRYAQKKGLYVILQNGVCPKKCVNGERGIVSITIGDTHVKEDEKRAERTRFNRSDSFPDRFPRIDSRASIGQRRDS